MIEFVPHREPLHATLRRTILLAAIAGAVAARWWGWSRWPAVSVAALWPSFGGHWVEMWFLDWLRLRIPRQSGAQFAARLATWFGAGILFGLAMHATLRLLLPAMRIAWFPWWIAGLGFVGIELFVHLGLQVRGRPSVYNGRG